VFQTILVSFSFSLLHSSETLTIDYLDFTWGSLKVLALFTLAFGLLEKTKKEEFVIGTTNSKTKKLSLQLINQMPNPIALVSKKGQILFCNLPFESMLGTRLGLKTLPTSIFKLANEEEGSN
jgi:c-di-AMP phosphodiesterase-like protein